MSDNPRRFSSEDSIEETRRKKMEEFRRSADHAAIRGEVSSDGYEKPTDYSAFEPTDSDMEDEAPRQRRRRTREINSYSDSDTKKRIERDSKKQLKQQKKEEKQIEKGKAKRNSRIFKLVWITMVALVAIVLSQFLLVGINDLMAISREQNPTKVTIHIPADPTMDDVANTLYRANVIKQPGFFKLYAKFTSSEEDFRQGDFEIETDKDYEAIINFLQSNVNRTDIVKVQITEGMNLLEIANTLHEKEVISDIQEFLDLCNSDYFDTDFTFLKDITNASDRYYKLEGYLFPDTYDFYVGEAPKSVISKFLNNYDNKIVLHKEKYFGNSKKSTLVDEAAETGYSMDEILTIASIIQAEAASRDDMYVISSILHNRLKYGAEYGVSKLNCDCTVYYPYRKHADVPESIRSTFNSTYDTNDFDGLPAGPICNPGTEAIKAAINPSETEYLYFCHDKAENGSTPYYSVTNEEHEAYLEAIENGSTATANSEIYNGYDYYYDYYGTNDGYYYE